MADGPRPSIASVHAAGAAGTGAAGTGAAHGVGATLAQLTRERRAQSLALDVSRRRSQEAMDALGRQYTVATAASAAAGTRPLCAHKTKLPVLGRFCRRTAQRCAAVDALLRPYLHATPRAPPLIHKELGRMGAGFGAVLQEKANLLLLGVASGRHVLYYASRDAFNAGHALLSPAGTVAPAVEGLPADVGFAQRAECVAALQALPLVQPS